MKYSKILKLSIVIIFLLSANYIVKAQVKNESKSLEEYNKDKFNYVVTVESNKDTLFIYGYKTSDSNFLTKEKVVLKRYQVLGIASYGFTNPQISLITTPFKIRSKVNGLARETQSGLTNIGLNFEVCSYRVDRYFTNTRKSSHKLGAGIWLAPCVEELSAASTSDITDDSKTKQLFLSTGITITYSYNGITMSFIPLGLTGQHPH